jgi:hypothetical protein
MIDVRAGDVVKFKYDDMILIGRVNSVGATYVKPFYTKCDPIFYVKVLGNSIEFIVKPEDVIEVIVMPEKVLFT